MRDLQNSSASLGYSVEGRERRWKEQALFDTASSQTFNLGHRHPSCEPSLRPSLSLGASQLSVTRRAGGKTRVLC